MAQKQDNAQRKKWKPGQKCEIYSRSQKNWVKGEIIEIFTDDEGEWVRVKYGRNTKEMPPNDQHLRAIASGVKWQNMTEAVRHELYPLIATTLGQSADELMETSSLKEDHLGDDAVQKVIDLMKTKKALYNNEIKYIQGMVERARKFKWEDTQNSVVFDEMNQFENGNDLNEKWNGLNLNLLIDIYSVHKALLFGQFKFQNYTKKQFMSDIQVAEKRVFGNAICSPIIEKHQSALNLSFHPSYVIDDDIFEVMACHFAVSLFVHRLDHKDLNQKKLIIRSIVVPTSIISIYDSRIAHKSSIEHLNVHLKSISPSKIHLSTHIKSDINDIESMTAIISELFDFVLQKASGGDIVIVFNRRKMLNSEMCEIRVFECVHDDVDRSKIAEMQRNYYLGFDLLVSFGANEGNQVRSYLRFGNNQKLRFYPESLLWVVPRLFARSDRMTASEMMKRLYGTEYKWGWRVNVDDPLFDQFYQIITRHQHITNNYNRAEMVSSSKDESECGLRDHLDHKLDPNLSVSLCHYAKEQAFDSDAILEDSLAAKRANDAKNSNVCRFLTSSGLRLQFRTYRHSLLRYRGTICCSKGALSIEECPYIEDVVVDLQRLKECKVDIDATNFWHFELESIVTAWSHILSVHKLLSDDDDHKENKERVLKHILQRVQCGPASKCKAVKAQREQRREMKREERIEVGPDAISAQIEAVTNTLFAVHCLIFHGERDQIRSGSSDDDQDTESRVRMTVSTTATAAEYKDNGHPEVQENVRSTPVTINFGRSVLRWLQYGDIPHFSTLKLELLRNPQSTIDAVIFDRLQRECAALSKDTDFTVDETLGLKAYSDTNDFQAALSRAHWDTASDEDRHSFYQWATTLYRAHLRSAVPIPPANASESKPRPLWTGLNQLLTLSHELASYYGPLSTTISLQVAKRFSNGKGQIYKFGSSYANPLRCTVGIDMQTISCYPQEKEVMLYHSILPIQSTTTYDDDPKVLVNHLIYSLCARNSPIIDKGAFFKKLGIQWTGTWIPLILSHQMLFKETKCNKMTVVDRLANINGLQISLFELVPLLRDAIYVEDDYTLRLQKTSKISSKLISQFVFAVNYGGSVSSNAQKYAPLSMEEFNIPCPSFVNSNSDFVGLSVFCRAKDKSFDFVEIDHLGINRYESEQTNSLNIREPIKVRPFEPDMNVCGNVVIKSASDVIISREGAVITYGSGGWDNTKDCDAEFRNAVTISSDKDIINEGCCD